MIGYLPIRAGIRPAIILMGVIAGFWCADVWQLIAALLAAWFIGAKPWEPYKQKSKDASD